MWDLILKSMYFFLPAYLANMFPNLLNKLPWLKQPINKKLFGAHKTWRGLIIAIIIGGLTFWVQKLLYIQNVGRSLALIDYADFSLLLGFLLGAGAILGDLLESYFKRKNNLKPGESWVPWDQLDFVIGALLLSFLVFIPRISVIVVICLISPLLHILANLIGYYLGINKNKW